MVEEASSSLSARERAGVTKRLRTQFAISKAARKLFAERGWQGTRMEDVAREAGYSAKTLYNHYSTKHALIGHLFHDLVDLLTEDAQARIDSGEDPIECVEWFVTRVAQSARNQRPLMMSFLGALQEQTIRVDGPPVDDDDVRKLAPFPVPLVRIIAYGQESGVFKPELSAADVGAYHTNGLLMRIMTKPEETYEETATFVLSQLLPVLIISEANVPVSHP